MNNAMKGKKATEPINGQFTRMWCKILIQVLWRPPRYSSILTIVGKYVIELIELEEDNAIF
jgi:hypothetical protein